MLTCRHSMQTRLPGELAGALKAIMGEYAEDMAVSQGSEESEEHQMPGNVQYPMFPSAQLLQTINKFVEVCGSVARHCAARAWKNRAGMRGGALVSLGLTLAFRSSPAKRLWQRLVCSSSLP